MPHKYLPPIAARVLPAAVLLAGAACGEPAAPDAGSPLVLALDVPAADSAARLGVAVDLAMRDSARFRRVAVWVDSAASPLPQRTEHTSIPVSRWGMVVYVPGPGRHTITVAVTDTAGRTASASATRTFRLPEVDYAAVALPDLGHGGGATFVHAGGAVAGWVATAQGRRRPAVWRAGALELVPAPDSVDVVATHLNGAGDVLLRFGGPGYVAPGANVRVRRADGALLAVGPLKYLAPEMARGLNQCCDLAADLTEDRVALASSQQSGPYGTRSALLDVATGRPDSVAERLVARNERGQMLGDRWTGSLYPSTYLETVGFALPPAPAGPAAYRCDPFAGRFTTELPVDLDNAGNVLSRYCGNFALRSTLGSEWLDRYVGRAAAARLSRTGGVVVARDTAGALTRWTLAARIPERLRVAGAWRLESLGGVNAGGAIVGQGVNASGRRAALLLTPAPR